VYGIVYTVDNTTEEAFAEFRFVVLKLYAILFDILVKAAGMTKGSPRLFTQDMEEMAIDKLRAISDQLEKAAQNCEANLTQQLDYESARLLRETPHFRERDVPGLSRKEHAQDEDEGVEGEDERLNRLNWISDLDSTKIQESLRTRRTPETCDWLLQRSNFVSWETSDSNAIFWLEGSCKSASPPPPSHLTIQ
jgi:hypothetical protein